MIEWVGPWVVGGYLLAASVVSLYALSQLHLLLRAKRSGPESLLPPPAQGDDLPMVTIQLPIYNERRVIGALLEAIEAIDWPRDKLEIQLLDDSDDETVDIARELCAGLQSGGLNIQHLRRPERKGFKAGALAWGLERAQGELICIFDADFQPRPDFLRRAVALLKAHPQWGLVQARWSHINRDASVLTAAQAFHLDAHFTIEQRARSQEPLMMGFNGTAGVWRRACIEDGGGWHADTLTEDLDLAFRAQLAGWSLGYCDALDAPAELPEDVRAIRSQQHRWMKGGAQVARKLLGRIWRSDIPFITKLQCSAHLFGGAAFGAVLLLACTSPLLGPSLEAVPSLAWVLIPAGIGLNLAMVILFGFYGLMCLRREESAGAAVGRMIWTFPVFMTLAMGLSLHNSLAVLEGWMGRESPFIRTPKRGSEDATGALYRPEPVSPWVMLELGLAGLALWGLLWALSHGQLILAVFLSAQVLGFGLVSAKSVIPAIGWRLRALGEHRV